MSPGPARSSSTPSLPTPSGATTPCPPCAHSRVRPLLSPATPQFLGVNDVEISLAPTTTRLPQLAETVANVRRGTTTALKDSHMLGAQVNGDSRIRTYTFFRAPKFWTTVPSDPVVAKAVLRELFAGWVGWMLNLIDY